MVKDITTSQLDFLSFEEVSDRAAETISGGAEVVTGGDIEIAVSDEDITKPFEILGDLSDQFMGLLDNIGFDMLPDPTGLLDILDPSALLSGFSSGEEA